MYRSQILEFLDKIYDVESLTQIVIPNLDDEFRELATCLASGDPKAFDTALQTYATTLIEQDRIRNYSQFSRIALKRLSLKFLPEENSGKRDGFITAAYEAHARACAFLFEVEPPGDVPSAVHERLSAAAQELAGADIVILTMVTRNYLKNLSLWLKCSERSGQTSMPVALLCLDDCADDARDICDQSPIDVSVIDLDLSDFAKVGNGTSLSFIWYYKVLALHRLVANGVCTVYSDLDSFWIGDMKRHLQTIVQDTAPVPDVLFMQSDNMPKISRIKFGVTAGCGFIVCRPTKGAESFLDMWRNTTARMLDDQIGLFQTVVDAESEWHSSPRSAYTSFTCNIPPIGDAPWSQLGIDRKSTRLNSSH